MLRTVLILLFFIFIAFLFNDSSVALAQRLTVKSVKVERENVKPVKVSWKQKDHQILHDSVCFNYPEGHIEYRHCRQQARIVFKERCNKFTDLYKRTRYPYNLDYQNRMEMYCTSTATYWP